MCGWHGDGIRRTQRRSSRRDAPFFSSQARHKIFHSSFTIDLFHYRAARFFLPRFFSPCVSPISSGRSDITAVHLGISNHLISPHPRTPPPRDWEAASETPRLTGVGWTNSARQENDGRRKGRDWVSGAEAAALSWDEHDDCTHIPPPSPNPSEAFGTWKPTSSLFIVQHLGSVALFFFILLLLLLAPIPPHPEHCSHRCSQKLESTTFLSQQLPLGPEPRNGNAKNMFYWTVGDK